MKKLENIVFIIQARTQSSRVPRKMIREFNGHDSLMDIAIQKILYSDFILMENFYLSVMDKELIDIAKKYKLNYYVRSEESTQEPISLNKVLEWYDFFIKKNYEWYVLINACNPIVTIDTINDFICKFLESNYNGLFAVKQIKNFVYDENSRLINKFNGDYDYKVTLETKMIEPIYESANTLYAGKLSDINKNIYMGTFEHRNDPELYMMNPYECFDIDYAGDWVVAQNLYKNKFNPSKFKGF